MVVNRPAPLVSVVIPTTRRHDLVQRALRSVWAQTMHDLEVIVVVDGPNPATLAVLAAIHDPRLHVLQLERAGGPGAARNAGAARARGAWLAFLDDDDEWLPAKLERQLAAAGSEAAMIITRTRVVTQHGTDIWPRRAYDGRMPIDEYLFDRRSLFRGEAYVPTSSFLLPRALFERTQFATDRHQEDTALLLRVSKQAGARIIMVPEALMVLYTEEARDSLGSAYEWRQMLGWADGMQGLLTRRAYSGFCLIYLGSQAARQRDYAGFTTLLRRAFSRGAPTPLQLGMFLVFWIVPIALRQRIRAAIVSDRPAADGLAAR